MLLSLLLLASSRAPRRPRPPATWRGRRRRRLRRPRPRRRRLTCFVFLRVEREQKRNERKGIDGHSIETPVFLLPPFLLSAPLLSLPLLLPQGGRRFPSGCLSSAETRGEGRGELHMRARCFFFFRFFPKVEEDEPFHSLEEKSARRKSFFKRGTNRALFLPLCLSFSLDQKHQAPPWSRSAAAWLRREAAQQQHELVGSIARSPPPLFALRRLSRRLRRLLRASFDLQRQQRQRHRLGRPKLPLQWPAGRPQQGDLRAGAGVGGDARRARRRARGEAARVRFPDDADRPGERIFFWAQSKQREIERSGEREEK